MASRETAFVEITPEVLLKAYACGIFPMAESAEDPALYWIEPEKRIIPLDTFHVLSRLAPHHRSDRFSIAINRDFDGVFDGCAEPQPAGRAPDQRAHPHAHQKLTHRPLPQHRGGYDDGVPGGGLYGVRLAARSSASMSHRPRDARRWRWCICGAARRRLHAARHPVRHRSSQDVRRGGGVAPAVSRCRSVAGHEAISPRPAAHDRREALQYAQPTSGLS